MERCVFGRLFIGWNCLRGRYNGYTVGIRFYKGRRKRYRNADSSHAAYLVFDAELFVGAGGISFYRVMPTFHNPSGNKAYIMNMYTHPDYRRRGIASAVLDLLVKEALTRGVEHISLEATSMGRPLYTKFGFVPMKDEMILPEEFVNGGKL